MLYLKSINDNVRKMYGQNSKMITAFHFLFGFVFEIFKFKHIQIIHICKNKENHNALKQMNFAVIDNSNRNALLKDMNSKRQYFK